MTSDFSVYWFFFYFVILNISVNRRMKRKFDMNRTHTHTQVVCTDEAAIPILGLEAFWDGRGFVFAYYALVLKRGIHHHVLRTYEHWHRLILVSACTL